MSAKKTVLEQLEEVRRYAVMSLAPIYLVLSGYTMEAALRNANVGKTVAFVTLSSISVAFMVVTIWLVYVAVFVRPGKIQSWTYESFALVAPLAALVFVIGLLDVLKKLLDTGVGELYATAYLITGLLLYLAIGFNVYLVFKLRRRRIKKKAR